MHCSVVMMLGFVKWVFVKLKLMLGFVKVDDLVFNWINFSESLMTFFLLNLIMS